MYDLINYYKVKQYLTITQVNKQNIANTPESHHVFLPHHMSLPSHKLTTLLTFVVIITFLFFIISSPMYAFLQTVV